MSWTNQCGLMTTGSGGKSPQENFDKMSATLTQKSSPERTSKLFETTSLRFAQKAYQVRSNAYRVKLDDLTSLLEFSMYHPVQKVT